jgi:HSP20 family protein
MESEFEPEVLIEEIPEARLVVVDLPGFKKEDLRVKVNSQGNLVISGEHGMKEVEEMTKVGGRLEKKQREEHRFRKVIGVPRNLNFDGITAKFGDERLRVYLPLLRISDQQNQDAAPATGKPDQSLQSKVGRSTPTGQQDSIKEQPAEDDQSARHPEAIRQDDDKEKPTVPAEKSNELVEERKTEAPEQAEELVGQPPISTHAQAVSNEAGSAHRSEFRNIKEYGDHERKKDDGSWSAWRTDQFPASYSSTFSKRGVLIASTVLILSVGLYITYRSRSRHRIY